MNEIPLLEDYTEQQYRNLKAIHYSQIKDYMDKGFSSLFDNKEESTTPSLVFGSLVDVLITRPEDFNFIYTLDTLGITPKEEEILSYIYNKTDGGTTIDNWVIAGATAYYPDNWKVETKVNKINKLIKDKYDYYCSTVGKILIQQTLYNDALQCSSLVKNILNSIVSNPSNDYKVYYQAKLQQTIDEVPYKCMFDVLLVDYTNKNILPIDIKTTSKLEYEFPKSYLQYKYYIQANLYTDMLQYIVNTYPDFKEYTIKPFTFIVINKVSQTPMIWQHSYMSELPDYKPYAKEIHTIFSNNLSYPIGVSNTKVNSIKEYLINNNLITQQ